MAQQKNKEALQKASIKGAKRISIDPEGWGEDEAAYEEYERAGEAIPLSSMEAWVRSWGAPNELPAPAPRKLFV